MSTAQLSPGTVVDGRFTIGTPGWTRTGAQGYSASDERGQSVVLTAYATECFPSGLVMERSLRELRQLQSVSSARVAPVIACGKLPDGGIYEVNPSLPGRRLDDLIARGSMPAPEASALMEQVGEGLLDAQKVGVIHRNLGPRVVFVDGTDVVVTGFAVGEPLAESSRGPLDTIAPEQIEGKVVDQRTLIYNLAALMHMLLTGAPLHAGDPPTQLSQHLSGELPDGVHTRLRRALGRDPRMRPMMLKQFIAELRAVGGGVARAPMAGSKGGPTAPPLPGSSLSSGGKPSSRGWTMFMKAEGDESAPEGGATAPSTDAPTPEAKPRTRGWTMFTEAATDEPAAAPAQAVPPEPKPEPGKPKTRGWTMFMEAEGGEGEAAAAESPAPAPPEPEPEPGKPKTRGWTMFMEAEEGEGDAAAEPSAVAPPEPEPEAGKPKTRGWTMFMEAEEGEGEAASAEPSPASAVDESSATVPTQPAAAAGAPKSRGWTMFTEAADDGDAPPVAASAPAVSAPAASAPAPVGSDAPEPEAPAADAPKKKRGWTVFMEKPIEDAKDSLSGVVPSTGESNAKGWTVFQPAASEGEPPAQEPEASPSDAPSQSPGPAAVAGSTMVSTGGPASEQPAAAGPKTVVATQQPAAPAATGRPQTMVSPPGSGPTAAAAPVQGSTGTVVGAPPSAMAPTGPVSGAVSGPISGPMSGPLPVPAEPRAIAPSKKGPPVGLIVVGVLVLIGVVVAAVVLGMD